MNSENKSDEEKLKQIKSNVKVDDIKSNFIFRKIFGIIKINKTFDIIKYNEKLQKRLSFNINDYIKYSQTYSPIEIELILLDNKYDEFINISEKDKEYYHIYFDDSKEEIKRYKLKENDKVNKIKIIIDYQVESFYRLFFNRKSISSIIFKKFSRININNMNSAFLGCSSLIELNFSNCTTNNVTDMSYMLSGCSSLKESNLSNFNTNNVTSMKSIFYR